MSIYIGGDRENEMLIEGLSASRFVPNKMLSFLPSIIASRRETSVPTVTSTTGRTWMDRNLGASRVATSPTDEEAYGDLYQWGRGTDGHEKRTSGTTSTLSSGDVPGYGDFAIVSSSPYDWRTPQNDNLWQGGNGVNNPCPSGFRLPTADEWQQEMNSWSSQEPAGAFASPLRLTAAGYRIFNTGTSYKVGSYGYYWSGSVDGITANRLIFYSDVAEVDNYIRAGGKSVRCIKD
jgi:uncharacterized protein (TIGR02145 family)